MPGSLAQTARLCLADGAVSFAGVIDGEFAQDKAKPGCEVAAAPVEGRPGKGRRKQNDAEIGVLPDGGARRRGRKPNALAHAKSFASDEGSGRFGACRVVDVDRDEQQRPSLRRLLRSARRRGGRD